MWVDHNAATGRVRLDAEAFDDLVSAARGDRGPGGEVADLVESGAVDAALSAVREPSVRLRLGVAGARVVQRHDAWVTPQVAALRLAVNADEYQLVTAEPQFLAAGLARVVRLGPRKVGARVARSVETSLPEDWFHDDTMRRSSALRTVDASFAWTVSVTWRGGTGATTVVDGPLGPFLLVGSDVVELLPVSPTQLWRRLTTALPPEGAEG
ncbi:MAG: hypothetical protein ACRDYU_10605 [Actinomycetes bacterium]